MPRMRRRAQTGADWQPPPEWFAATPVGQENMVTGIGEIEQSGFGAGLARRATWRRVIGLLVVLTLLFPIIGATVLLITRIR